MERKIPAGESAALTDELVRLLRLAGAWRQRARDEQQWGDRLLLGLLAHTGPRRATDLAAETLLDLSTVSRQIRSLVDRGLVERRPDPEDRRGALLSATEAGLTAVQQYREQRDHEMDLMLADWSARDREELVRLLGRFNDELGEHHARHAREAGAASCREARAAAGTPAGTGEETGDGPTGTAPGVPQQYPEPHHRATRASGQSQETHL